MKLTNKYVEEKAIDIINENIKTQYISSRIEKGSTEESWDGHLLFYETPSSKVGVTKIPVQVKGTTKNIESPKFSVEINDLLNYKANGIIYFVVKIIFDDEEPKLYKIYAKSLVGKEIDELLKKTRKNQKNITICFNHILNKNDFLNLCNSYKIKQNAIATANRYNINDKKISPTSLKLIGTDDKLYDFPEVGKKYFLTYSENNIERYEPEINISEVRYNSSREIFINSKKYFNSLEIRKDKESINYIFEGLTIKVYHGKKEVEIFIERTKDNLKLYNSLLFIKELILNQCFYIGESKINLPLDNSKEKKEGLYIKLNQLEFIIDFCNNTKISQNIDFFNITEDEIIEIYELVYRKENKDLTDYVISTKEFNVHIVKFSLKEYNLIFNIFDKKLMKYYKFTVLDDNNEVCSFVPFYKLNINDWKNIDVPNLEKIISFIDEFIDFSRPIDKHVIHLINTLIFAFDLNNKTILLDIAEYLISKILFKDSYIVEKQIIKLEIKYRKNYEFDDSDREFLDKLIKENSNELSFIAYVLLKDKYNANKVLIKLNESIYDNTIYNLYKRIE